MKTLAESAFTWLDEVRLISFLKITCELFSASQEAEEKIKSAGILAIMVLRKNTK